MCLAQQAMPPLLDVSNLQNDERSFLHTPALAEVAPTTCPPRVSRKRTHRCQADTDEIRRLQKSLRRRCDEIDDINHQLRDANKAVRSLVASNHVLTNELMQQKV